MLQQPSIVRSTESSLLTSATDDEIHVAQILLHMTTMIWAGSGLKWGSKRRRSRSDEPYRKTDVREERAKAEASPVTPLAFLPSESDDNKSNKTCKKRVAYLSYQCTFVLLFSSYLYLDYQCLFVSYVTINFVQSMEAYVDMIEELSQQRDLLRGEIESVTNYYNKLINHNSQLKAMKQEALNSWPRKEEPKLESRNLAMEITSKNEEMSSSECEPLVEDQMAEIFRRSYFGPISAQSYNGLKSTNHMDPTGIPDLNVSAEEISPPLDLNGDRRARFAEARRRRMDIIRVKSMRAAASVFKFPRNR
ncbi:uncharacterized protein LOC131011088 isoform X1 [Salvia miltiorrhiza]|uniref:uncharacterized protein LOC131011088 isoform X1 n=1 Tax=Salvia miltiorrhiza TaxID=226208 RepID=UPI0025AC2654|nr:uncharacterized protein LOC131011088 isoform X1 [Salvia miltiorrhiza]